jgi:enoyl-CoA hydratase/carnithine racemase
MVALSRNVPAKVAFEMLTTGQFIDAARAREVGLVNRVVAPDALSSETRTLALLLASKLTAAVRIGKRGFYDQLGLPLDQAYAQTGSVMVENMLWRDTEEGIAAFLEKRPPDWQSGA